MNNTTKSAYLALFDAVKDNPEQVKLLRMFETAVNTELIETRAQRSTYRETGISNSIAGRDVLQRAWAADPKRTEMDLLAAGYGHLVSELGAWWAAEEHRASLRGRDNDQDELDLGHA